MPRSADHRPLVLTRRGRLLRTVTVLLALLLLLVPALVLVGTAGTDGDGAAPVPSPEAGNGALPDPSSAEPAEEVTGGPAAATASPQGDPTSREEAGPAPEDPTAEDPAPEDPTDELTERHDGILQSGTVGDGTWTVAEPATAAAPADETVHTYALRVENGIDIDAGEAAAEVAAILTDPRGWQTTEDAVFHQVTDPEQADVTISLASPPTVDELCAPARTAGVWSCRIGADVALNSDRWLHLTPTYDDAAEYRAYLVNHEIGHYLGHRHVDCDGEGRAAPVMLQQSIDLQGCRPNAWPVDDGRP